jgi:photosystem II stability/assembly factor-like uncharacterized protein
MGDIEKRRPEATVGKPAGTKGKRDKGKGRMLRFGRRSTIFASVVLTLVVALATAIGIEGPGAVASALGLTSSPDQSTSTTTTTSSGLSSSPSVTTTSTASGPTSNPEDLAPHIQVAGGSTPGHGSFNAVTCVSATACFAAGADPNGSGAISSTTNGRSGWLARSVPSGVATLDAITCPTTTDCIAVGQGAILNTTDGGQSWRLQTPSAQTTLLGVACATKTDCLSVGVAPNRTGAAFPRMMRTTDGGTSWSSVGLPTSAGIESVSCPSASFCVAVGDAVLVSEDGGATWTARNVDGGAEGLNSVACASPTYCVAVGPNPAGLSQPAASAFAIVTKDGGSTWGQLALPAGSALVHTITCPDATDCVAAGPNVSGTYQGSPTYLTTSDGGANWAMSAPPTGISDIAGLSCVSTSNCLVVGRTGTTSVSAATTDGASWSSTSLAAS